MVNGSPCRTSRQRISPASTARTNSKSSTTWRLSLNSCPGVRGAGQNHGQRVQKSVFECVVDPAQWVKMRRDLVSEADGLEDSLRFYFLGSNWERRVEHVG